MPFAGQQPRSKNHATAAIASVRSRAFAGIAAVAIASFVAATRSAGCCLRSRHCATNSGAFPIPFFRKNSSATSQSLPEGGGGGGGSFADRGEKGGGSCE